MDLRTVWLSVAAWAGCLVGLLLPAAGVPGLVVLVPAALLGTVARHRTTAALLLVLAATCCAASLRAEAPRAGPVAGWAEQRASVVATLSLRSDPVLRHGRFGDYVVTRAQVREVTARGRTVATAVPVLVLGDPSWSRLRLGAVVRVVGRLGPALSPREAGVLSARGTPEVIRGPSRVLTSADRLRTAVRKAAAAAPGEGAALVPALVTGDDQGLPGAVVEAFRTAGLTHLTAVSGTNLTLVLASLLLIARGAGARGRGLVVVGLAGVVGFVLLARPEPSVVRAAAMGVVALLGMGPGGRPAGVRALGVATFALLVADPWLALSWGFALSVSATAGLLLVAPAFRDALAGWLPRWLAEAVAVPVAAQLACTPLVAALSGQVSLVAVLANLLAAPVVGPATVLGLGGGVIGLVLPGPARGVGWVAGTCAQWVVLVAQQAAALPTPALDWSTGALGLTVLSALSVAAMVLGPRLLGRRAPALLLVVVLVLVLVRPTWHPGWPPSGWVMVMCDVGQGDALVLATGPAEAVVVDAGPEPSLVDGCLDRLGVRRVPVLLLTHFHADHVEGVPGVLSGRAVGEVEVTALREPTSGAVSVDRWAAAAGVPVRVPAYAEVVRVGRVAWSVRAPRRLLDDSPNDASLVLLVETRGVRLLLSGDVEPPSQAALLREGVGPVDVLKVPHHGSRYQDPRWLTSLGARLALVSVGQRNDYGHPAASTLDLLREHGTLVRRTDESGDLAVVVREGRLGVVARG